MRKLLGLACLIPSLAFAQGRGQGGIVLRDDAIVYVHSDGNEVEWKLKRGDAVAGITMDSLTGRLTYQFDEVKGRLHVMYFQGEQKGFNRTAWMDPKDLAKFLYDGGCGQTRGVASPIAMKGFSARWNACFEEGRDGKLEVLREKWEKEDAARRPSFIPPVPFIPTPMPTPSPTQAE